MKQPLSIQRRNSGGMTLIEVVISVCMFTIAMVGLGFAMGQILDISTAVRGQTRMLNNCQQVLQETMQRPVAELESYNPPDAPSKTTIGTFEIEKVTGTGEIRLSLLKKDASAGAKLFQIDIVFLQDEEEVYSITSYLSKLLN